MTGYTKGPWTVRLKPPKSTEEYYYRQLWEIKGPNKNHDPIAAIKYEGFGKGPSKAVREANARLIAAAPELLAALEAMHACHRAFSDSENWTVLDDEARLLAEKAIAKAKGAA